jgi:hypothetical protein
MMNPANPMPGGMDESPYKGESNPSNPSKRKPSDRKNPAASKEASQLTELGGKWGVEGKPEGSRTRSQAKRNEGRTTSKVAGQMPPGQLSRTVSADSATKTSSVFRREAEKGLDRPEESGGDRPSEGLRRPIASHDQGDWERIKGRPGGTGVDPGLDRPSKYGGDRPERERSPDRTNETMASTGADPENATLEDIIRRAEDAEEGARSKTI